MCNCFPFKKKFYKIKDEDLLINNDYMKIYYYMVNNIKQ